MKLVREVAAEQLDKGEPSALVVGFPAVLDKGRKIVWNAPNLEGLNGKNTYRTFVEAFSFPVYFEKVDFKCFNECPPPPECSGAPVPPKGWQW